MLSDPVAEAFGLIHRHLRVKISPVCARPVCLLKRARVGALSEGNMVEATRVMRKVQPSELIVLYVLKNGSQMGVVVQ